MLSLLWLALLWSGPAAAQGRPSGFELALHGSTQVLKDRPAHFRGVAYRVHGLAQLKPLANARVRARYATDVNGALARTGAWREVRADRSGFFQIDVPMPAHPQGSSHLEVRVGDGQSDRLFEFPLSFSEPWIMDLFTDRRLYEPGETVHGWVRLRDRQSRRPIAGRSLRMTVTGTSVQKRSVTTGSSGVAAISVKIPEQASEGSYGFEVELDEQHKSRGFRIGTRTYERIFAAVKVTPATAQPHQPVSVEVKVTTASGNLVRGAAVEVSLDTQKATARTDGKGVATLAMQAPAYMTHATGSVSVSVQVSHPAHGSTRAHTHLGLAVPLILSVEAVPKNDGLVPELDSQLYIRLSDGAGKPPVVGTSVRVTGQAIRGGTQRGVSDAHGIVTVPVRLPRGVTIDEGSEMITTVVVHVEGPAPRTAAITVKVAPEVEVVPTVSQPVAAPGEKLVVTLARRQSAARVSAVVELLAGSEVLQAHLLKAGQNRIAVNAPADRLGVIHVRARPLHQRAVVEGVGGIDAFLVRPPVPSFPTLKADKQVYRIKSSAKLTLRTAPGAQASWAAVLVRDLAAHAGEAPFRYQFLQGAFARAILDPKQGAAETLLRTALAAHLYQDDAPGEAPPLLDQLGEPEDSVSGLEQSRERGVLRDPYPLADELSRRGVGPVMNEMEKMVKEALERGRLDDVSLVLRGKRSFKPDILDDMDEPPITLGDDKLTVPMLLAADPSFTYDSVGRRIARERLVHLLVTLATYLDPGDDATTQQRAAAREPSDRWLPRMVEYGLIDAHQLVDPWGGTFALRKSAKPGLAIAVEAANLELVSPGPDGKLGTRDDIADPFARAVPAGTPYAVASGEDRLIAELSRLAPGDDVLQRLQKAYQRITAEVAEEEQGDAVNASVSEGFGALGGGMGGGGVGSGYGMGSGRGGMRGRSARPPQVRVGQANVSPGGISGFARVIRERFPPTLMFRPAVAIDPSGATTISVPLSEAVTTYIVEAVVWSADGWTWSTQTRIRVDQETVIDAPVPRYATVGDTVKLPVRVGNRLPTARALNVAVYGSNQPDKPLATRASVRVPGEDTVDAPVTLTLGEPLDGKITVGVTSASGVALDAVRRPITVHRPTRRVRRTADLLASGVDSVQLDVDARASPREGSEVTVRVGADIFDLTSNPLGSDWIEAWTGDASMSARTMKALRDGRAQQRAFAVGAAWTADSVSDSYLQYALQELTEALDTLSDKHSRRSRNDDGGVDFRNRLEVMATFLVYLAPALRDVNARPDLAEDLEAMLRLLRRTVQSDIAEVTEDAGLWATAAAGLALTAPRKSKLGRVRELVRRVRRQQLRVGDYTWVAARKDSHAASALLALAELRLGERKRALALLRTLGRLHIEGQNLTRWEQVLARAVAIRATSGKAVRTVRVRIDGKDRKVKVRGGLVRIPAPALGRPGKHEVQVKFPRSQKPVLYYLRAVSEFGMPWDALPERPGSLSVAIEGKYGVRDARAELELVVRNRSPRAISAPIVEVNLPAGAEIDEDARKAMQVHTAGSPAATRGTLRLQLRGLAPGSIRRVPLPIRWSVAGSLQGLGIASYPADRPDDLSVSPPRVVVIAERKAQP